MHGLLRNLDRERFEPVVIVQQEDGEIARLMWTADVPVRHASFLPSLRHGERAGLRDAVAIARASRACTDMIRQVGADIVHTNDGRTHAIWAAPAKLAGARLVWHHRSGPDARGLRLVAPRIADAIVSVSAFALGGLDTRKVRTQVIHSPFDTEVQVDRSAQRAALVAELGCSPDTRFLGFFGVMIARKRPFQFVEMIAALRDLDPDRPVFGLLFGTPLDISEAELMAHAERLGVANAIRLMGYRYPGAGWIAGCDLLMVPAKHEPFGRTLIESMLVGTPVVATRSGGNIEALCDGRLGPLVPLDDPAAMARAALRLLSDDREYRRLAIAARAHALDHFGAHRHAAAVMAIYDELVPTAEQACPQEVAALA
ncbi:glycosyltransferase [Sphingomonas sp. IC-11]|nr:glycosyltransferase [Sphingomonas sp. IC-11]